MSSIEYRYHSVECENIKPEYTEHDNVDFNLNFPGRSLVCGSIRLEGEVEIYPVGGGTVNTGSQRCRVDHMIGAHAFISGCVTTLQNQGIIENATELPRYAKMVTTGTASAGDMMEAKYVCELRSSDVIVSDEVFKPRVPSDVGGGLAGTAVTQHQGGGFGSTTAAGGAPNLLQAPDFSIKPVMALNNVAGSGSLLNYTTSGEVKLSFNLARNLECLYGQDATGAASYALKNLEVCYTTVPEQPGQQPLTLRTSLCLKSNMNSRLSNHSARVPAICDSMSISFIRLSREVSNLHNNTALEKPTNISNIKYMFNDSTNSYVTYELRNRFEILHYGIKALSLGSHNNVRADLLSANESFVAGLDFGSVIDLSKQKFNIQIDTEINTDDPFLMFQYYHSLVSF
tara:strand:- start:560 stop:1759 length:1200 start_codon:yes stop_codon:yes gene_type:complete